MLLANSFVSKLHEITKYGGNVSAHELQILNATIDNLIALDKTDYLKISIFFSHLTPLIILANKPQQLNSIMAKIIKYYSVDEINYANKYGETAMSRANSQAKIKIIEDAITNNPLVGFIAASDKYYQDNDKDKYNKIGDDVFHDMRDYMGGKKKSKRRRNKNRKTRKHK
jgi:hypothetical protein